MPKVATLTATSGVLSPAPLNTSSNVTVWPFFLNLAPNPPPRPPTMITRVVPSLVEVDPSPPVWASAAIACAANPTATNSTAILMVPPLLFALFERLEPDDGRAVVAADPEGHGRRGVVDVHAADVGVARQQVVDRLPRLRVQPRDEVGDHRPGPRLVVPVDHDVVRRGPARRDVPVPELAGARVEHAYPVAAVLREPQAVLGVDHAAARRDHLRVRGDLVELHLARLRVDAPDVAPAEVGEPSVILRVGDHVVDVVRLALGRALEGLPGLDLAGGDVEAVHAGEAVVLRPYLAVDVRVLRAHHVDLRRVDVLLGRELPGGELLSLAVELEDRRLVHVPQPQVAVAIRAQPEQPGREARLVDVDGKFPDLAGLRVEAPEVLLAEARVPGDPVGVDDDVVRRDRLARQVVLGVDDARRAAGGARVRLERVAPLRRGAAVDRREVLGGRAVDLDALVAALLHQPLGAAQLRVLRDALVDVALHPREHGLHEGVGVVAGPRDALERVAADAVEEQSLLRVAAREARHPLAVRELRGEVGRLLELQVE